MNTAWDSSGKTKQRNKIILKANNPFFTRFNCVVCSPVRCFWTCARLGFILHNQGGGGGGGHGTRITRDCTCTAPATSFTGFFSLKYLQKLLHKSVKTACSSSDKVLIGHDSGILGFRIRHTAGGSRNSTNDWNPESESKFHWQKIRNPRREIQNPRLLLDSLTWSDTDSLLNPTLMSDIRPRERSVITLFCNVWTRIS